MRELIEEALDKIAFAIEPEVAHPMDLTIRAKERDRNPAALDDDPHVPPLFEDRTASCPNGISRSGGL